MDRSVEYHDSLREIMGAYRTPTIIITVGLILAVLGFQWTLRYDLKQSEKTFYESADQVYQGLSMEMHRHAHILDAMSQILGQMRHLQSEEFSNVSMIFSRATYFTDFYYYVLDPSKGQIRLGNDGIASQGGEIREYISSATSADKAKNMEGLPEIQAAIEQAAEAGTIVASRPYQLDQKDGSTHSYIVLAAPAVSTGNKNLFLVGVMDISLFFSATLMNSEDHFDIRVEETSENGGDVVYEMSGSSGGSEYAPMSNFDLDFMTYRRELFLGQNKLWNLTVIPSMSADVNYIGLLPWITFLSILAITGLLSYIFFRITMDKIRAQDMVEQQTSSLRNYATRLEMSNRDLDDFAYVASHDLKEPLRGLYNYAEILEEDYHDSLDENGRQKLRTLKILAKRMESFIEMLFEYSKISRIEMAMKNTNIRRVIDDVVDLMQIWLKEQNAELVISSKLPTIECDAIKVGEVFRNLITNGVKYNDEDLKRIEIGCNFDSSKKSAVPVFWVKDNGIGIAHEHKDHIFKIFKRLHEREKYGGGTGAGLTIVWKIIQRHGGKIWVESKKGEGSTFFFTLKEK